MSVNPAALKGRVLARNGGAEAFKPAEVPRISHLTLTLPLPPNMANGRMHWRAKERARNAYVELCDWWRATRVMSPSKTLYTPEQPLTGVTLSAVIALWNPMDDDNCMARLKWSVDWLVSRKFLAGDSRKHVRWAGIPEQRIDRSGKPHSVTITIQHV